MLRCRTSASNSCQSRHFLPVYNILFYFRLHQELNWAAFGLHVAQDHGDVSVSFFYCVSLRISL